MLHIDNKHQIEDAPLTNHHEKNMAKALDLARSALDRDEFPVGCVMVYEGRIIAQGERLGTRRAVPSEIDHAEMIALRRLESLTEPIDRKQITVYATLEPCLMCFGALLISGIGALVYAYEDAMGGGTACDRTRLPALYRDNDLRIIPHVCRTESLRLFQDFFSLPHIDYWGNSHLEAYTLAQSS
jgi:tRNA(adenine34) deaminase